MATISQILGRKWPGKQWRMEGDDYSTLVWITPNETKPLEADIRSLSATVDSELAAEAILIRQQKILNQTDSILKAFEVLSAAIKDLQTKANVTGTQANRINALITQLNNIRSQ